MAIRSHHILWLACMGLLTYLTVDTQVTKLGWSYLETFQLARHASILDGTAGDPWQYRILPEYLVEGMIRLLNGIGLPHAAPTAFISLRVLQNLAIFIVAWMYYRGLGLGDVTSLLGIACLGWGMTLALYDSDLQFSTYFDLLFYLLAGWLVCRDRGLWITVPLMVLAALNRETSGLIPILAAAGIWASSRNGRLGRWIIPAAGLCVYLAITIGLRYLYPQQVHLGYGHKPGTVNMLVYNITRDITYVQVLGVTSVLPVIALYAYRRWPATLRAFFWALVPAWIAIHMVSAILAEARLLLVPQALVFIPGAFWAINLQHSPQTDTSTP